MSITKNILDQILKISLDHNFCFSVATIVLTFFSTQHQANASGEVYVRQSTANSLYQCKGGNLVEQYHSSGNVHGSSKRLTLACLQSSEAAKWVLISVAHCNARQVALNNYRCDLPWKEQINWSEDHRYTDNIHIYKAERYLIGKNCSVVYRDQSSKDEKIKPEFYDDWKCESISILPKLDISIIGDREFISFPRRRNDTQFLPESIENIDSNSYVNGDKYE
ncbi:MAG: hypothetical protein KME18_09355 [Phormidium tanganyikae FI6-MK23]|nr:hypothetical protein [Phormidium tanganyikae FI6-MK23]